MTRTLFLHIGIHKTGTSAIQNVCMANYRQLLESGFLFPRAGFTTNTAVSATTVSGHRGLIAFFRHGLKGAGHRPGRSLIAEMESTQPGGIIVSSEVLSAPQNRDAVQGIAWFRDQGFHVKLIVYLRRQDIWLDSFYRERLKWLATNLLERRSIEQFWREVGDEWLHYGKRLDVWIAAVGVENAIVRSYDDVQQVDGVVPDFFRSIGVDERLLDLSAAREAHNASLPASAADFFRAVNSSSEELISRKPALISAAHRMQLFDQSTGTLIGPALFDELRTAYTRLNDDLRRELLSGPTERFSFYRNWEHKPLVEQGVSYDDSILLLNALSEGADPATPDLGTTPAPDIKAR